MWLMKNQNKSFRVQSKPLIGGSWTTEGTATRPIGIAFNVSYTYK